MNESDTKNLEVAIDEARKGLEAGGVPVGACLTDSSGEILASGHNERVQKSDPIAHGEISCLREAGRQQNYKGYTLYTTLSPCVMCRGAIKLFQIPRVVVGEATTFSGDLDDLRNAGVEVVLADSDDCKEMMKRFQQLYPQIWNEDIGIPTN